MPAETVDHLLSTLQELEALDPSQAKKLDELSLSWTDATAAIRDLVKRGWITTFQANLLNKGRGQELLVDKYLLLDRLGDGGMGEVFRARHRHIRTRVVALKVIREDKLTDRAAAPQLVGRFLREPEAIALLSHPNIVKVFDAGKDQGRYFMVMEHLEGSDLQRLVKEKGPLPLDQARDYLRQALLGLQHLDERGIVHRDIKPANLFVVSGGVVSGGVVNAGPLTTPPLTTHQLKILDLGLALVRQAASAQETADELTGAGRMLGTPLYMAPEQALNPHGVDIRADLYSLGRTFFYLLTGQLPSANRQPVTPAVLAQLRPGIPASLANVVCRLTAVDPWSRFQTPAEVLAALDEATTDTLPQPPPLPWRKLPVPWLVAGGVGALLLLVIVVLMMSSSGRDTLERPVAPGPSAQLDPKQNDAKQKAIQKDEPKDDGPKRVEPKQVDPKQEDPKLDDPKIDKEPGPAPKKAQAPPPRIEQKPVPTGALGKSRLLVGHTTGVRSVAFVPGKKQALTCTHQEVILWDLETSTKLKQRGMMDNRFGGMLDPKKPFDPPEIGKQGFGGFDDWIMPSGVAVAPSGKVALFGSPSNVTLWDLEGWKKRKTFGEQQGFGGTIEISVAFSADGRRALYGNFKHVLRIIDVAQEKELPSITGWTGAFSADGSKVLTGEAQDTRGKLSYWDIDDNARLKIFGDHQFGVAAVAIAPDGKTALSAPKRGNDATLWSLEDFTQIGSLTGHEKPITSLAFSSDSRRVLTGSEDTTVRLWEAASGKELDRFTQHARGVHSVAFSSGDTYALSGSDDQTVGVWLLKK